MNTFKCDVCHERFDSIFHVLDFPSHELHNCPNALEYFKNDVNRTNKQGRTPLRFITSNYIVSSDWAKKAFLEAAHFLLKNGADPKYTRDCVFGSAYEHALLKGLDEIVRIFDEYDTSDLKEPDIF